MTITVDVLSDIVEKSLRTNMTDWNSKSHMNKLFVSYMYILCLKGLAWIPNDNPKNSVYLVLSTILPMSLRRRIESDLDLAYGNLREGFKGFMQHSIRLSEASQLVYTGPKKENSKHRQGSSRIPARR